MQFPWTCTSKQFLHGQKAARTQNLQRIKLILKGLQVVERQVISITLGWRHLTFEPIHLICVGLL